MNVSTTRERTKALLIKLMYVYIVKPVTDNEPGSNDLNASSRLSACAGVLHTQNDMITKSAMRKDLRCARELLLQLYDILDPLYAFTHSSCLVLFTEFCLLRNELRFAVS